MIVQRHVRYGYQTILYDEVHHQTQGEIKMKKTINRNVKSSDTFQAPIIGSTY